MRLAAPLLRASLAMAILAAGGCIFAPNLGDGQVRCGSGGSCPPGQSCGGDGLCHVGDAGVGGIGGPDGGSCAPQHCYVGWCGPIDDGCGHTIDCGSCNPGDGADMGASLDMAGCVPSKSCMAGVSCGTIDDGCGKPLSCGDCQDPRNCSANKPNQCACTPRTCASVKATCGTIPSGCGAGTLDCDPPDMGCPAGTTCGGGGPYTCGTMYTCNPRKNCPVNACGVIPDGCSGVLHCGSCPMNKVCGGGGKANICA